MKEVLLTALSGLAFGLLSLFGSDITLLQIDYQAVIVSGITVLLTIKLLVINATTKGAKQAVNNACTALEIAINLLVFAYHVSNSLPLVAAIVGVLGWMALLAFMGSMLIIWIKKAEK